MRILIYAAILYFLYRLIKGPLGAMIKEKLKTAPEDDTGLADAELIKDPQCGTYFMKQRGVEARIHGKTYSFCSEKCRDEFTKQV
jgi:YHS domain-containing protein